MTNSCAQRAFELAEMIVALSQYQRITPIPYGFDHIVTNAAGTRFIIDQLLIEILELHAFVGVGHSFWAGTLSVEPAPRDRMAARPLVPGHSHDAEWDRTA